MDNSLKNIIWFGLILIAAGATYGMMSTRLQAVESKQMQLEKIILSDIPEIKERVIRLEVLLERALSEKYFLWVFSHNLTSQIYFSIQCFDNFLIYSMIRH